MQGNFKNLYQGERTIWVHCFKKATGNIRALRWSLRLPVFRTAHEKKKATGLAKWTEKPPRANDPHNKKGKGNKSKRERMRANTFAGSKVGARSRDSRFV